MQKFQPDNFQTKWNPKEIPQILVVKNPYPASQAQLSTCWWRILLSPAPEISTRRDVLPCTLGSTAGGTVKALLSVKGRWEWRESLGYLHEGIQRDPFSSQLVNWLATADPEQCWKRKKTVRTMWLASRTKTKLWRGRAKLVPHLYTQKCNTHCRECKNSNSSSLLLIFHTATLQCMLYTTSPILIGSFVYSACYTSK